MKRIREILGAKEIFGVPNFFNFFLMRKGPFFPPYL
jgi:hypothetical protein